MAGRAPFAWRRRSPGEPRTTCAPAGRVVYAVGDVHGRLDLLAPLLDWIAADGQASGGAQTLVMLGDYVDRGPDAAGVLERLAGAEQRPGRETVCLRGNHEQALLDFLADPPTGPLWMRWGGAETLRSYGVPLPACDDDEPAWSATAQAFAHALPASHNALLHATPTHYTAADYLFVHAGVRPGVPLALQTDRDLLSIRRPFLEASWPGGEQAVVAGHTPMQTPLVEAGKIVLDTGAYATGVLTGLRLEGAQRRLVTSTVEGVVAGEPAEDWD